MYKIKMNFQTIHIILEVLIFCCIIFYFSKNFKTYKTVIEDQYQKIEELEEKIELIEKKLSLIFGQPVSRKMEKITEVDEEIEEMEEKEIEKIKNVSGSEENYNEILDKILLEDDLKTEPKEINEIQNSSN